MTNNKILLDLSTTVKLVRIGNVILIRLNGCTSLPSIPTEHLPIIDSTSLIRNTVQTPDKQIQDIVYRSDGTNGVYYEGQIVTNYNLWGNLMWLAN